MPGSVRIGKIGGVDVEIHVTFLLTVLWAAWQGAQVFGGLAGAIYGTAMIVLVFLCVLLHELGHGMQARAVGVGVQRITLLPIGGLTRLESTHATPRQELLITLAGPAVNLGLAAILGGLMLLLGQPVRGWRSLALGSGLGFPGPESMLPFLVGANLSLFAFNMLPAFPMDGGRVVRSLLALLVGYETATRLAAVLGRLMAFVLVGVGLLGLRSFGMAPNPLLLVVGLIVYFGASQEAAHARHRLALSSIAVGQVTQPNGHALRPSDPITPSLTNGLFAQHAVLPVVVDSRVIGLLTPQELRASTSLPDPTYVAHVMRTDYPVLHSSETLWTALDVLRTHELAAVPVVRNGALHGMLTLDDIRRASHRLRRHR